MNGDDLDAVAYVTELALEFRQKFHRDVFVDIVAYRRHGHNESDEPRFTQPALYKKIAEHPNPLQVYSQRLIQEGRVSESEVQKLVEDFKKQLSEKLESTRKQEISASTSFLEGAWSGIRQPGMIDFEHSPETGVEKSTFLRLAEKVTELPEQMNFFQKSANFMLSGEQWFWKSRCWIGGRRDDGFCYLIGRIPPGSYQWTGFRKRNLCPPACDSYNRRRF